MSARFKLSILTLPIVVAAGCMAPDATIPSVDDDSPSDATSLASAEIGARLVSSPDDASASDHPTIVPYDLVKPSGASCDGVPYRGGHVLNQVKIQNIFWGSYWNDTSASGGAALRSKVDAAWKLIGNNRTFYSGLVEYGDYFQAQFPGHYLGAVTNNLNPPASVNDSDVQAMLNLVILFGLVPPTDENMLYVVYLPKGTISHPDLEKGWGAHHYAFTSTASNLPVYYATITPYSDLDSLTLLASHEIDEAVADPNPDGAPAWGEIGDPCEGLSPRGYRFDGYLLERTWSNNQCGCVTTLAKPFSSRHDIAWIDSANGNVGLWQMNGSASVRTYGTIATAIPAVWKIVGTGDFDGDGEGDLLWYNTANGQAGVWLLHGESIASWNGVPDMKTFVGSTIQGVGDFDGDGLADVAWRNSANGAVTISLTGAQFNPPSVPPSLGASTNWSIVGMGDFDGDHKTDILWRDSNTGDVGLWLMDGTGVRSYLTPGHAVSIAWKVDGVGDFDGDGKADIVWRNNFNGDVGIWLMNGGSVTTYATPAKALSFTWKLAGTGDIDGDNRDDLIWRETTTGNVGVWLMNGGSARTMDTPAKSIPAEWQIVGTLADQT